MSAVAFALPWRVEDQTEQRRRRGTPELRILDAENQLVVVVARGWVQIDPARVIAHGICVAVNQDQIAPGFTIHAPRPWRLRTSLRDLRIVVDSQAFPVLHEQPRGRSFPDKVVARCRLDELLTFIVDRINGARAL